MRDVTAEWVFEPDDIRAARLMALLFGPLPNQDQQAVADRPPGEETGEVTSDAAA
ncbi:hypothetical protein [Actinomadura hibisca]|uniref:hypothetical protein n=1 Tax=Actinomadura hibisca TaxID=68565 RepID=UPI000A665311|nr:hypothetical protein [Actinomadura hibisca]